MSAGAYLTKDSVPVLNAVGTRMSDILYAAYNSSVEDTQVQYLQGRYLQSLGALNFGSINTVLIPSDGFVGTCSLYLELYPEALALTNPASTTNNLAIGTFVNDGWGYDAIEYIEYQVGAMNTKQQISGEANWATIAGQCQDKPERSRLWKLGGQFTNAPTGGGQNQARIGAHVILALPWSAVCEKKPYPADIITSPITINIKFRDTAFIIGGSGLKKNAFASATFATRQAHAEGSYSLRNMMASNPSYIYSYPCVNARTFAVSGVDGRGVNESLRSSVNLNNIENGDLLGIAIQIVPQESIGPLNSNVLSDITNVRLEYNGNQMYNTVGMADHFKMVNQEGVTMASDWDTSLVSGFGPFDAQTVSTDYIWIDFSRNRAICLPSHMPNVPRYDSQQFVLTFNTPSRANPLSPPVKYTVKYTYFYTAIISSNAGTTNFYIA